MEKAVRRFKYLVILTVVLMSWMFSSTAVSLAASEDPWEAYEKAVTLLQEGDSPEEVVSLIEKARSRSDDPILFARASLLLAEVFSNQLEFGKAHTILGSLYSGKTAVPEAVKDEALLRDARLFIREGQKEQALTRYYRAARDASGLFTKQEARIGFAWQLANSGNWSRSDSVLNQILNDQLAYDRDERVIVLQARSAMANQQPEAAIDLLGQSKSSTALKYLALAYEQANKPIMAVGVYKKIHDLHPNTPGAEEALFQAGEVFMRSEDWLAARTQFTRLLQAFPETTRKVAVYFRLGWAYLKLNQTEEALAAFRNGSSAASRSYFTYMEGECLRHQGADQPGKYQEAILKYNSIVALDPDSRLAPISKLRAALTQLEQGAHEDAIVSLRQFLALYPKDELAPAATFLLATNVKNTWKGNYYQDIVQKYPEGVIFDAAVVALQKQDYDQGDYQEVINRKTRVQAQDSTQNDWHRAHHLLLAESAYYLRQYEQARNEYALVRRIDQDDELNTWAALGDAWCLAGLAKLDSAADAFEHLRQRLSGENYARASYGLASAYFTRGQYEEAIQAYPLQVGAEGNPIMGRLMAKSLFQVAECYFRLEYYSQAIETWEKLVQSFPNSELAPQAQYRIGDTYFQANHFDEAIAAFQAIQKSYSAHPLAAESFLRTAQSRFNAGSYNEAISDFEAFINAYPENESAKEALEGIQLCYYQLGQTDQASEALEKLIEQSDNDMLSADARFRLAQNYLAANEHDRAVKAFKEILTLYPGSSYAMDAQYALAQAFYAKKEYASANDEFARYLQYFPESPQIPEVLFNLGVGYFSLESYLSAADYFQKVIQEHRDSEFYGPALQNIGWCYDRLGEKNKALEYFDKYATELGGDEGKLQAARIKSEMGKAQDALPVFKALQFSENADVAVEAAYHLGVAYLETGNIDMAKRAFNQAIKKGEGENYYRLNAMSQLAATFETEESWQDAIATYELLLANTKDEQWMKAAQERINTLSPLISESSAKVTNYEKK